MNKAMPASELDAPQTEREAARSAWRLQFWHTAKDCPSK
jgi:hypothetical protein